MLVEIYSDAICPWCYIGKRRLERARAMRPELRIELKWRAFQLNPWMPAEGMARAEYLAAKFGAADAERVYGAIRRIGLSEGVDFAFDRIRRTPSTVDAHRLIRWAARQGANGGGDAGGDGGEDRLVEALFQAYFLAARDIGDAAVLAEVAGGAGYDATAAAKYLAGEEDADAVRAEDAGARQMGVQGVPCFIVDRRYAVSGAQEPEYFMPLFDLAAREPADAD